MEMRARLQRPDQNVVVYIYDKLQLLASCNFAWASSAARRYVIDGLIDLVHAAVLAAQPPDLSPQIFVRLDVQLQQGATPRAEEPYVQAAAQPLTENVDPKTASSNMKLKVEEATSDMGPVVMEDAVHRPNSLYQADNELAVFSVATQASFDDKPSSTLAGSEKSPPTEGRLPPSLNLRPLESQQEPTKSTELTNEEKYYTQLLEIYVRRNSNDWELSTSTSKGPSEQPIDMLSFPPITPSKRGEEVQYHFADTSTSTTWLKT